MINKIIFLINKYLLNKSKKIQLVPLILWANFYFDQCLFFPFTHITKSVGCQYLLKKRTNFTINTVRKEIQLFKCKL